MAPMNRCDAIDRPNPRLWDAQSNATRSEATFSNTPAARLYSLTFMQGLVLGINVTRSIPVVTQNAL
jgi:hypothetical protein